MQTPLEEFKKQTKKSSKSKKEQLDSLKQQKLREPPQSGRNSVSSKRKSEADFEKQANRLQKKVSKRKSAIGTFFSNSINKVQRESLVAKREIKIAFDKLQKSKLEKKRREALAD